MSTKTCTKCGQNKCITNFYKDRTKKDGHEFRCKTCKKQYCEDNKERIRVYGMENRERLTEYQKRYRKTDKGRAAHCKADKKYYESDRGRKVKRAANMKYQQTSTGKAIKRKLSAKRRALKRNQMPNTANETTIHKIYQNCPEGYHVDHIVPLNKGGTHHENNLCYLPASINISKSDKTIIEFGIEIFNKHVIYWQDVI